MTNCEICKKTLKKFTASNDWAKRCMHKCCAKAYYEFLELVKLVDDDKKDETLNKLIENYLLKKNTK